VWFTVRVDINQSENLTVNQSINQSIKQTNNQSIKQTINQSIMCCKRALFFFFAWSLWHWVKHYLYVVCVKHVLRDSLLGACNPSINLFDAAFSSSFLFILYVLVVHLLSVNHLGHIRVSSLILSSRSDMMLFARWSTARAPLCGLLCLATCSDGRRMFADLMYRLACMPMTSYESLQCCSKLSFIVP
jgi:hypothetical protein